MGAELRIMLKVLSVSAFKAISGYSSGGTDKKCSDRDVNQALHKHKTSVTVKCKN
jgi:hypothetical protein